MSLFRKILMTLMVVGGIGSSISAGTYASFSATTSNPTSTYATGSLVLDRKVGSTSCFSVGGTGAPTNTNTDTNARTTCAAIISENRIKLGDSFTYDLTLSNAGTLPGTLSFGATDADSGTGGHQVCKSSANDVINWTAGTGNMCQNTSVVIQEYDATFTTATSTCAFPVNGGGSCAATTPATLSANAAAPYPVSTATSGLPESTSPTSLGTLSAGASRYFRITFTLLSGAGNELQGRRAEFALMWVLA